MWLVCVDGMRMVRSCGACVETRHAHSYLLVRALSHQTNAKSRRTNHVVSYGSIFVTTRKRSCGKVLFSQASVFHSVGGGGLYVTSTHDTLELTVQPPLVVTSDGHHWRHRYLPPHPQT